MEAAMEEARTTAAAAAGATGVATWVDDDEWRKRPAATCA